MKTTRIAIQAQGSWRWQTPYRIQEYEAKPSSDGRHLIWKMVSRSRKLTRTRAEMHAPAAAMGGIGNRRVMSDADRDAVYSAGD